MKVTAVRMDAIALEGHHARSWTNETSCVVFVYIQLQQQAQMQAVAATADQAAHSAAERRVAAANASAHVAAIAAEAAELYATAAADAAELAAAASSAMLSEDPSSGRSALNPHRSVAHTVMET